MGNGPDKQSHAQIYYTLKALLSKSVSPENLTWSFTAIDDAYTYGFISKEGLPLRELMGTGTGKNGKGMC